MEAKKSLGQNFLRDEEVVAKIISAISAREGEVIVEVGPGDGVLTEALAKSGARVIAIELDDRLIPILRKKFQDFPNVSIVHQSVLDVDVQKLLFEMGTDSCLRGNNRKRDGNDGGGDFSTHKLGRNDKASDPFVTTGYRLHATPYRVVGNLPYYITSAIVRKFLESECAPGEMFFMVQKEVGERICAKRGKMSILAVSVQYYAHPSILFGVSKEMFDPIPKVDSVFIKITNSRKALSNNETGEEKDVLQFIKGDLQTKNKMFFRTVRIGFSAKRKTLENNLTNGFHLERESVGKILEESGVPMKARAQDLDITEWKKVTKILWDLKKF